MQLEPSVKEMEDKLRSLGCEENMFTSHLWALPGKIGFMFTNEAYKEAMIMEQGRKAVEKFKRSI